MQTNDTNDRYEKAREILAQGLDAVQQDPEALAAYLRFRAHFRSYSPTNTMLILAQRSSASCVMGFQQWKKHGRHVGKGERGLMIYAPILRRPTEEEIAERGLDPDERVVATFKVTYVWDITQTAVIPGCEETALQYTSPIPRLEGEDYAHLRDELEAVATDLGYAVVTYSDRTADGYCAYGRRVIGVRADLSPNDAAATMAHELAHAVAHEGARDLSHAARELQAEGAAYLVCYALGLDTSRAALPYLKSYEGDGEMLLAHLTAIDRIAGQLLDAVRDQPDAALAAAELAA